MSEAAALASAASYIRASGLRTEPAAPGQLTWNEAGSAVWRFRWRGPIEGAPDQFVDVDATTGIVQPLPVGLR